MKKILYVSDLDGTLLDRDSRVSSESVAILSRLITENGLNFTIATARTPATVVNIMERVPVKLPMVVMNGAATWDNTRREFVCTSPLDAGMVTRVCDIFECHGLCPMVYRRIGNRLEVHHCGSLSSQEEGFVEERAGLALKSFHLNDREYKNGEGETLLIFSMNEYERLKPVYADILAQADCSPVFYHDIFDAQAGLIETYAPGVSKAVAVRRLADEMGAERLVVFGDNRNDIPMMQIADYAVAPENAMPEVKAVANEVIDSNASHSVARYLATIIEK